MGTFKDLTVYKKAFNLSMKLFELTKNFPKEEQFALTSQIRRSSRAVCSNVAEGYRKRLYLKHFISKATDADMENSETMVWMDYALTCKYIDDKQYKEIEFEAKNIGRLLNHMIENPEKYQRKTGHDK